MQKKYCPKCKSTKLNFMPWLGLMYECRDCGWRGPLVLQKSKGGDAGRKVKGKSRKLKD